MAPRETFESKFSGQSQPIHVILAVASTARGRSPRPYYVDLPTAPVQISFGDTQPKLVLLVQTAARIIAYSDTQLFNTLWAPFRPNCGFSLPPQEAGRNHFDTGGRNERNNLNHPPVRG